MFNGFSDKTTDFLWGIRFNNERGWFLEHKEEYLEHLQRPMNALGKDLYDNMAESFGEQNLVLHVSRIYRDARRLYGRGPYKDHLWMSIRLNSDNWDEHPSFWFEITPENYSCGLFLYPHRAAVMEAYRRNIDAAPQKLISLAEDFEKQDYFVLGGEEYRRAKGKPGGVLDNWYNRKWLELIHTGTDFAHYKPNFAKFLSYKFASLMPLFEYLNSIPPLE